MNRTAVAIAIIVALAAIVAWVRHYRRVGRELDAILPTLLDGEHR